MEVAMYPFSNPTFPYPVYNTYNSFPQSSPRLVCKQVGSIDEARSAIIDPVSLYLFVDFSNGKIYVKKMGDNGHSEFYQYTQEIEQVPVDPMDEIRQRLSNIEAKLGGHNEPVSVSKDAHSEHDAAADGKNEAEQP